MVRILKLLSFLLFLSSLQAQVKTITLRKPEPYDTLHLVLSFSNDESVTPRFPGGKSGFDVFVIRSYNAVINKGIGSPPSASAEPRRKPDDTSLSDKPPEVMFYEGKVLDKARFVNVKTYCDTDGTIQILSQDLPDHYSLAAIRMVRLIPKLIPAMHNDQNVPVYLTIPVRFLKEINTTPSSGPAGATKRKHRHSRLWEFFYKILHPFSRRDEVW